MEDYVVRGIEVIQERINTSPDYHKATKTAILKHVSAMKARDANLKTVYKHLFALEKFLKVLGKIDVNKATKEDIEGAMSKINALDLSPETKRDIRAITKNFYKHLLGEGLYYPRQVAWIKTTNKRATKMLPDDLITEDEVKKLLGATKNPRDKAIIALLFDSGIRAGELLNMKRKDVDLTKDLAHIVVNGKTGMRRVPIMFSVPYIVQYLTAINNPGPNEPLWPDIGSLSESNYTLNQGGLSTMLKKVAKRARIEKRIYAHLFRHSRASYYANKLTEQQLKVFFGWTGDSRMASVYVHLSGRDIDNAILQANGQKPQEVELKPKLSVKICQRCQFSNTLESVYCARCATPLDIDTAMAVQDAQDKLKKSATESYYDPKLIEEIVHEYLMRQRDRKARK